MMKVATEAIFDIDPTDRIHQLKRSMLEEERFVSIEQAKIVTRVYRENEDAPVHIKRARSLRCALNEIAIRIAPNELIVGNRTAGVRGGVVFPESGLAWVEREIESISTREQDRFSTRAEDIAAFRAEIAPYWRGRTLEDRIHEEIGVEIAAIARVVKINQKDHAQGHIAPDVATWLQEGPRGIRERVERTAAERGDEERFYEGLIESLRGAEEFMMRYAELARSIATEGTWPTSSDAIAVGVKVRDTQVAELRHIADMCDHLATQPPRTFYEALQSVWFLFVILHMESNASSFSPGRMDQYLYPFYQRDRAAGILNDTRALELIEAIWIKFNQIVYLRNSNSARYFAGFPIGFNVAIGGQLREGGDAVNELTYLFLKAQADIGLPQPNLSARLHRESPEDFVRACARVIGMGSGMPQIFNDEAVIPALQRVSIAEEDARDYAIVGCVELTTAGNNLGWSDAAMFNLVKALELALTGGVCLLDNLPIGPNLGSITEYGTFAELEQALRGQIDHFVERMIGACHVVDRLHGEVLPSPFLSSVVDDCIGAGIDVTNGGARYNLSGIQAIQPANIADSLAALRKLVFEEGVVDANELHKALHRDFEGSETLRQRLLNKAPKYGNDVEWVDEIANTWAHYFAEQLSRYTNRRGGPYHMGLYTVSAHVPMGQNVGATPDGRHARDPLADGGMSAVYGRDLHGPTALLQSVAKVDSSIASNGTLLNMKFDPEIFSTDAGIADFAAFLRGFVDLKITHVQFNVLTEEDLRDAQTHPERYRNLTVRVAGYTAYFTDLARDLQSEIIARTTHTASE